MSPSRATEYDHAEFAKQLNKIDDATFAWFAGWLSADGSILNAQDGRPRLRFGITDRDPLEKFSDLFGNAVSGPHPSRGIGVKDIYLWQISGWRAAMLLERVRPWLSDRYKSRMDALSGWEPRGHAGRKLTPENIHDIKHRLATGAHGIGRKLAAEYGVTDGMISSIKKGRSWNTCASSSPVL